MLAHSSVHSRNIIAHSLCILAVITSAIPLPFLSFIPMPSWPLILIFYYSIMYPTALSPFSLTLYGLVYDGLHMSPFGVHGFLFPLLYLLLQGNAERLRGRRMHDLWQHFLITVTVYGILLWLLYHVAGHHTCSTLQLFNHLTITALAYPFMHHLLTPSRINKLL